MVIAFGEVLWDLLPSGKKLGGALANCAYRLYQLGTPVLLVSRVGEDALGNEAKEILDSIGLPCSMLQTDPEKPTGIVDVTISPEGDADYVINRDVAYDYITCTDELLTLAKNAKAIVFGNLIQREKISRETLYKILESAPNALKIVDINLRKDCYSAETLKQSLLRTDVLKLNEKEVQVVSSMLELKSDNQQDFCREVSEKFNVSTILVSLGARGVYAFDEKEGDLYIPGFPINVTDTVGAGDNFTAGFIHERLNGANLEKACLFANLIGSLVATKVGGMPSISPKDIEEYQISLN